MKQILISIIEVTTLENLLIFGTGFVIGWLIGFLKSNWYKK